MFLAGIRKNNGFRIFPFGEFRNDSLNFYEFTTFNLCSLASCNAPFIAFRVTRNTTISCAEPPQKLYLYM